MPPNQQSLQTVCRAVNASRCWRFAPEAWLARPLGDKPLVDISNDEMRNVPGYVELQTQLLALSHNSKEIIAEKSGHFIIIDRPDVVVDAISQVVRSVRSNSKL